MALLASIAVAGEMPAARATSSPRPALPHPGVVNVLQGSGRDISEQRLGGRLVLPAELQGARQADQAVDRALDRNPLVEGAASGTDVDLILHWDGVSWHAM